MRLNEIPEIDRLSIPEKILLVEDLWDSIASDESSVPVPQSHIKYFVYNRSGVELRIRLNVLRQRFNILQCRR